MPSNVDTKSELNLEEYRQVLRENDRKMALMFFGSDQPDSRLTAEEKKENELFQIDILNDAIKRGRDDIFDAITGAGFSVNKQDSYGFSALHMAAACGAKNILKKIIASPDCDFLLRDNQGRLASEVAYSAGDNLVFNRLLAMKERKQAKAQGIDLKEARRAFFSRPSK